MLPVTKFTSWSSFVMKSVEMRKTAGPCPSQNSNCVLFSFLEFESGKILVELTEPVAAAHDVASQTYQSGQVML